METKIMRTTKIERWGFALFMAGQGIVNTFVGSFFQLHMTNIGITAYSVGILLLITRVWDAANDPMFGIILDKTQFKTGKFLPWLRTSNILLPIATILLFAVPLDISVTEKLIWAYVAYFIYGIAYTLCDVPIFAMTSAITDQVHERINIMSRNALFGMLMTVTVAVAVPQIYPIIGGFHTSIVIAATSGIMMFFMSRYAKERYINKDDEKVTIKNILQYLKDNKYLRIGFLGIMVLSMTNVMQTVLVYFAVHNLGDLGMVSVLSVILVLPILLIAALMPRLTKRFDKFHLLIFGIIGYNVMNIICYFAGYENFILFTVLMVIRCIFVGIFVLLQIQLTGDFVEYGEYITGKRLQGIAYSIQTFVFKFMNAIPLAAGMLILGFFGFIEGEGVVQPESAVNAIWVLFTLSPIAGALAAMPIFAKYKLRDKTVQIMAACNSGDITREEAQIQLEEKGFMG